MRIQLWKARGIPGYLVCRVCEETGCYHSDEKNSILVQTDWDYPSLARTFGWNMEDTQVMNASYYGQECGHDSTDGTVKCGSCGLTPTTFISDAAIYLDNNLGKIVDDQGYFPETVQA